MATETKYYLLNISLHYRLCSFVEVSSCGSFCKNGELWLKISLNYKSWLFVKVELWLKISLNYKSWPFVKVELWLTISLNSKLKSCSFVHLLVKDIVKLKCVSYCKGIVLKYIVKSQGISFCKCEDLWLKIFLNMEPGP